MWVTIVLLVYVDKALTLDQMHVRHKALLDRANFLQTRTEPKLVCTIRPSSLGDEQLTGGSIIGPGISCQMKKISSSGN